MDYIELIDNSWEFAWCPHGQITHPDASATMQFVPASVPGCNIDDLLKNGVIPDPFHDLDFRAVYWVELQDFWYRTLFSVTPLGEGTHCESSMMAFDGIDTFSRIWIDGVELGATANMFRRYQFEISLAPGDHEMYVLLSSPVKVAESLFRTAQYDSSELHAAFETKERLVVRKMQMSYGWDNHPRLVTSGIYRPVRYVRRSGPSLRNVWLSTHSFETDHSGAKLVLRCSLDGWRDNLHIRCRGECRDSRFEDSWDLDGRQDEYELEITVSAPMVWWPNGFGGQPLYDVEVILMSGEEEVDVYRWRFGIRTIHVRTGPPEKREISYRVGKSDDNAPALDGGDEGPWSHVLYDTPRSMDVYQLIFVVNGREIPIVGADWQPCDAVYSRAAPPKFIPILKDAKAMNLTMIRVWGGGYIEDDRFYETCSELGLLVWQDFMFASGIYPQEKAFLEEVESEARDIVLRLRNHTCLAAWCGDNESDMSNFDRGKDPLENKINHSILPLVVEELDHGRYYHPSSPYGVEYPRSPWSGDNRNWGAWNPAGNYLHIRHEEARFISEGGAYALPSLPAIESHISKEHQWPLNNNVWNLHGGSVDTFYRDFPARSRAMWEHFARFSTIEEGIDVSQFAQAWGAMALILHCRRRWPETGGVLWWKLDDCWPCMDGGLVDYGGNRRMSFYSVRYAASPRLFSIHQTADNRHIQLNVINHGDTDIHGDAILARETVPDAAEVGRYKFSYSVAPFESRMIGEIDLASDVRPMEHYYHAYSEGASPVKDACWTLEPACAWRLYKETSLIRDLWYSCDSDCASTHQPG